MIGLSIEFLAGRYHATPWDHQVNEGVVEWPPSPWRILRALVAASYRLGEPPERSLLLELMTTLAEALPSYHLPRFTAAHTRHYMPVVNQSAWKTAKVIDTFYALEGGAAAPATLEVWWEGVELRDAVRSLLERLCRQVSYLGRAESWVEVSLLAGEHKPEANAAVGLAGDAVQVLAPLNREGLVGFRSALDQLPKPRGKKNAWVIPQDILQVLELDVGEMQRQGWSGIPGARWVSYGMKSAQERGYSNRSHVTGPVPTVARFALAGAVLPKLTQAVSVGERFRQALMAWSKDEAEVPARVFSGKKEEVGNENEVTYREGQGHAWYLPEVNERGEIDQMVVFAAEGFGEENALRALGRLPKVWGNEGFDLKTVLVALGQVKQEGRQSGVLGQGRVWRSLTPFVLARFPKKNKWIAGTEFQVDGPQDQALRFLGQLPHLGLEFGDDHQGVVKEDRVVIADADGDWLAIGRSVEDWLVRVRCRKEGVSRFSWVQFQRSRRHGNGSRGGSNGFWLEVEFAAAVDGPIALGYGAHFGLGVLVGADG
jgi:CRISPR-associated protein Csb2